LTFHVWQHSQSWYDPVPFGIPELSLLWAAVRVFQIILNIFSFFFKKKQTKKNLQLRNQLRGSYLYIDWDKWCMETIYTEKHQSPINYLLIIPVAILLTAPVFKFVPSNLSFFQQFLV